MDLSVQKGCRHKFWTDILVEEMPDVVFITGDLTKDGEIINHREL